MINDYPIVGPYKVIDAKTKKVIYEWPDEMPFDMTFSKVEAIYAKKYFLVLEVDWKE